MSPAPLVQAMLDPALYPNRPSSVELRTTNISWVFLAGELAYKVKRPVVVPFLDYGTLDRRRRMCHEEVRLNRRLAPPIYLRVVGVAERPDGRGVALVEEDDPRAVEYAVEMRRVDEEHSFESLIRQGELEAKAIRQIAGLLARFHNEAAAAPADAHPVDALVAALEENLETLRGAGGAILNQRALDAAETFTRSFLAARRAELDQRATRGLVRDCHGDLRAEHVIVPADEPPYVYDCVEFNPALRRIDVAADLAFLVMDLVRLGAAHDADLLVAAYRDAGGDPGDDALLSFLASYRAWVRAKVACLGAVERASDDPDRPGLEAQARELFDLGRRFAWRARQPMVLLICGVAGSGKSTLARALAQISDWPHLSSDAVRKRLAGIPPTAMAGAEHYSAEFTERTYRELGAATETALAEAGAAIVDATFHLRAERDAFRVGLGEVSAPMLFVQCQAPVAVLVARAAHRERDPGRLSDAGPEIVRRQLAQLEPLDEVPEASRVELATDRAVAELASTVELHAWSRLWS